MSGLHVYRKAMQSLFTERYSAPMPSEALRRDGGGPARHFSQYRPQECEGQHLQQAPCRPRRATTPQADCWESNGNCAVITKDFKSAMLFDAGLTRGISEQLLSLVKANIDGQQTVKQEQENAAYQKRKSMM